MKNLLTFLINIFSTWELIIMIIAILCLILLFALFLTIRSYVKRFDFDDEIQK